MTNAIIHKLRSHLAHPIDTECKVVYLLCEIRKLLPEKATDTATLRLHCNWALHVDLDFPLTTLPFLRKVDSYVSNSFRTPSVTIQVDADGNTTCHIMDDPVLEDFVYLSTFRQEMEQFLIKCGLPTSFCRDDALWLDFLNSYAGVIEDGSLACKSKRDELLLIKKVMFTKGRSVKNGHLPFSIKWDILLKDGRKFEVEVGAPSNMKGRWLSRRLVPDV
jgi:hypothetical protein